MKGKIPKILSVALALVLVLSFSMITAVPVAADVTPVCSLGATGTNTAVWSDASPQSGTYSALLTRIGTGENNAWVEFAFDGGITVTDVTTAAGWGLYYFLESAKTQGPQLELRFTSPDNVDPDGAGHVDISVDTALTDYVAGSWQNLPVSSSSSVVYFGNDPTDGTAFSNLGDVTLATVLTQINDEVAMGEDSAANWELTRVRVEIWAGEERTCYVDTVTIDATTYDLEFVAQEPVDLGAADDFAVLAGSAVTNTGPTVVIGDLGLSPGSAITGFFGTTANEGPGVVIGAIEQTTLAAAQAQADLTTAYNDAAGRTANVTGTELGDTTKTPGAYSTASGTLEITGTLTLDAGGDANAVFIFKAASTLVTAENSVVSLDNGAQASNVFWQVGSSATLGTNSTFSGTILALTAITVESGSTLEGRALAQNAAVTFSGACTITVPEVAPIAMDKDYYSTSGTVNVTVFDVAANTNPVQLDTIKVQATSTTDTVGQILTLTETGVNTGIFTGSFTLTPTAPPATGQLVVADTNTIYVWYGAYDSGPPATVAHTYNTTATVDTTVPTIDAELDVEGVAVTTTSVSIPDTTPAITATYTNGDSGSPIDTTSVVMKVNGVAVTPDSTPTITTVTYTSPELAAGTPVTVTVDVSDIAGNAAVTKSWSFTIASAFNVTSDVATMQAGTETTITVGYTDVNGDGFNSSPDVGELTNVVATLSGPGVSATFTEDSDGTAAHPFTVTAQQAGTITATIVGTIEAGTTDTVITKTLAISVTGFLVTESWADVDLNSTGPIAMTVTTKTGAAVNTGKVVITAPAVGGFQKDVTGDGVADAFQVITIDGVAGTITYDSANPETYAVADGLYQVTGIKYVALGDVEVQVYAGTVLQAEFLAAFTVRGVDIYEVSLDPATVTAGVETVVAVTVTEDGDPVIEIDSILLDSAELLGSDTSDTGEYTITVPATPEEGPLSVTVTGETGQKYGATTLEVALPTVSYVITDALDIERNVMLTNTAYTVDVTVNDALGDPLDGFLWIGTYDAEEEEFTEIAESAVTDGVVEDLAVTAPTTACNLVWMIGSTETLGLTQALVEDPFVSVQSFSYDVNPTEATVGVDTTYTVTDNYGDPAADRDIKIVTPSIETVTKTTGPAGTPLAGQFKYNAAEVGDYYVSVKLDAGTWQAPITVTVSEPAIEENKGDFDGDGDVDLADFVEFAAAYGSSTGDANYNVIGDFDDDGEIGLADFVEFAAVYGT